MPDGRPGMIHRPWRAHGNWHDEAIGSHGSVPRVPAIPGTAARALVTTTYGERGFWPPQGLGGEAGSNDTHLEWPTLLGRAEEPRAIAERRVADGADPRGPYCGRMFVVNKGISQRDDWLHPV
jgi:hypothetical protein